MPQLISAVYPPAKTLLVTGFEPFGGQAVNPSWEAVSRLPDMIGGFRIVKARLPVVFGGAGEAALMAFEAARADDALCVGQAGGRAALTPEMVAINLRWASAPDNAGLSPHDEPVVPGGPDAYFSTLPVRAMAEAAAGAGVPSAVSYSAGAYVCNDLMYTLLNALHGTRHRAGFVHVPFLPEQARDGQPCMALEDIAAGLTAMIGAL